MSGTYHFTGNEQIRSSIAIVSFPATRRTVTIPRGMNRMKTQVEQ
jgi:hypothetical protein